MPRKYANLVDAAGVADAFDNSNGFVTESNESGSNTCATEDHSEIDGE